MVSFHSTPYVFSDISSHLTMHRASTDHLLPPLSSAGLPVTALLSQCPACSVHIPHNPPSAPFYALSYNLTKSHGLSFSPQEVSDARSSHNENILCPSQRVQLYLSPPILGTCIIFQFTDSQLSMSLFIYFFNSASSLKAGFTYDASLFVPQLPL